MIEQGIYFDGTEQNPRYCMIVKIDKGMCFGIRLCVDFISTNTDLNNYLLKRLNLITGDSFWIYQEKELEPRLNGFLGMLDQNLYLQLYEKLLTSKKYRRYERKL